MTDEPGGKTVSSGEYAAQLEALKAQMKALGQEYGAVRARHIAAELRESFDAFVLEFVTNGATTEASERLMQLQKAMHDRRYADMGCF